MKGNDEMAKKDNAVIPELIETATKLPKEAQETLVRLGQDIIFINKVKNGSK